VSNHSSNGSLVVEEFDYTCVDLHIAAGRAKGVDGTVVVDHLILIRMDLPIPNLRRRQDLLPNLPDIRLDLWPPLQDGILLWILPDFPVNLFSQLNVLGLGEEVGPKDSKQLKERALASKVMSQLVQVEGKPYP